MSTSVSLGLLLAVILGVFLWLVGDPRRKEDTQADDGDSETQAAEDEVRDVDAFTSPEEAEEELPDWGPGAPKP